jgi:hypothetical protein
MLHMHNAHRGNAAMQHPQGWTGRWFTGAARDTVPA